MLPNEGCGLNQLPRSGLFFRAKSRTKRRVLHRNFCAPCAHVVHYMFTTLWLRLQAALGRYLRFFGPGGPGPVGVDRLADPAVLGVVGVLDREVGRRRGRCARIGRIVGQLDQPVAMVPRVDGGHGCPAQGTLPLRRFRYPCPQERKKHLHMFYVAQHG